MTTDVKGLECQLCESTSSFVVDSRPLLNIIRRRRRCGVCGHKYTTYEVRIEDAPFHGTASVIRMKHVASLMRRSQEAITKLLERVDE